jgi:hypothetical protein
MASRTCAFFFALAVVTANAEAESKAESKLPLPTDIIYGTGEVISDVVSGMYGFCADKAQPILANDKVQELLKADHIELACSKLGCKKKDVSDKLSQAQAVMNHAKTQAYEHGAKLRDTLDGLAVTAVAQFEKYMPSYKSRAPTNFMDLALVVCYFAFVLHKIIRIAFYVLCKALKIWFTVCCCGCCCRSSKKSSTASAKGKANSGGADAKATSKSKAKPGKK